MVIISIVVPVYNVYAYIERCLDSIKRQTFIDFEVIIVDDGSTDDSHIIYEKYTSIDKRFRVIKKANEGVSKARNTGIENATGEFLMFVDSDDWLPDDALETLYNAFLNNGSNAELVVADIYTYTSGITRLVHIFKNDFSLTNKKQLEEYQKTCIGYGYNPYPGNKWNVSGIGSPWNKLYCREVIENNNLRYNPYVKGIYDDNLFTLYFISHCKKIVYTAKPVYYYRIVPDSITNSYKPNSLDISRRIFESIKNFINEQENPDIFNDPFNQYVIRRLSAELSVYYFSKNNPNSFKNVLEELRRNIQQEPYRTAIRKAEYKRLMPQHKLTYVTAKMNWPWGIWFTFRVRRIVKTLLRR